MSNSTKCSANVTTNRNRVKVYQEHANYGVYQDVVFLHDKQKFEIELHNPYTFKVLAKIKFNGNYISESGIVINPGQRIFLERFIDKDESFVFSTYEIDNNEENRKATVNNGNVDVEFYSEMVITTSNTTYYGPNTTTTIYPSKPSIQPPYWYTTTGSLTAGVSTYVMGVFAFKKQQRHITWTSLYNNGPFCAHKKDIQKSNVN